MLWLGRDLQALLNFLVDKILPVFYYNCIVKKNEESVNKENYQL